MQIRSFPVKPSLLHLSVFGFFAIFLLWYILVTHEFATLIWAFPTLIFLLIIPMLLNYMSQKEYEGLVPVYETEAKTVKIREISEKMTSKPVRFQAVVDEVRFRSLNRPHFVVSDRTGTTTVKMFTTPREDVRAGDLVEVLGQVIHRYIVTGDPVVNGVSIRVLAPKGSTKEKKV